MNVLVTNNHLDTLGGTERFTYDLIEELSNRDNLYVEYYTNIKGEVSERIEKCLNVKFMSKDKYDLILANHNSTIEKVFGKGFIIQTIHGIFNFIEKPSVFSDAYVAISEEIQINLAKRKIPSIVILNGINHNKLKNIGNIKNVLSTIVSMSQSGIANSKIEQACKILNVKFIRMDKTKDKIWDVYKIIEKADLIIGLGRSAYDAMACGRPVIVYDERGYNGNLADGYLNHILFSSIKNNCSGRFYKKEYDVQDIVKELKKYEANDGLLLQNFSKEHLNIKISVDKYLEYYLSLNERKLTFQYLLNVFNKVSILRPLLKKYASSKRSKIL